MTMAEVTARLPYICRPFSCLDERTVDGASAVNCLLSSSTARGAEGLQVHHHEIIILHITHLF